MDQKKSYSVIGGDTRFFYTASYLAKTGRSVSITGMDLLDLHDTSVKSDIIYNTLKADTLILGLPFSKNGKTLHAPFCAEPVSLSELRSRLHPGQIIFAGMTSPAFEAEINAAGARVIDYYKDPSLTLFNALLTAEAITGILIKKLPCSVFGTSIAITGYGRIGFYLSRMLHSLGANVYVFARDPLQISKAAANGVNAFHLSELHIKRHNFRALINTIPVPVINYDVLRNLNRDCMLIETAGAPYGIAADDAKKCSMAIDLESGLPGKYAPETAGIIIAKTILRLEREVTEDKTS